MMGKGILGWGMGWDGMGWGGVGWGGWWLGRWLGEAVEDWIGVRGCGGGGVKK